MCAQCAASGWLSEPQCHKECVTLFISHSELCQLFAHLARSAPVRGRSVRGVVHRISYTTGAGMGLPGRFRPPTAAAAARMVRGRGILARRADVAARLAGPWWRCSAGRGGQAGTRGRPSWHAGAAKLARGGGQAGTRGRPSWHAGAAKLRTPVRRYWLCRPGVAGPADLALETRKSRNLLKKRRRGSRHGQGHGETISGESGTGRGSGSAVRRSAARHEGGCAPQRRPP
jgi:hypothetical protein